MRPRALIASGACVAGAVGWLGCNELRESPLDDAKGEHEGRGDGRAPGRMPGDPDATVKVEGAAAEQLLKLLEALEELDDVQKVDANFEMDADAMAQA